MEITLEMVERLREKADVSYGQAKQALEYSQGNLLDALIYLEEQGAIPKPRQAYYSTREQAAPPLPQQKFIPGQAAEEPEKEPRTHPLRTLFTSLRRWLIDNELEVWRRQQPVTAVPVLIVAILLIFAYYITIPLLILGLFLGFRYRFSGPDLERDSINDVIEKVAGTADSVGRQVMDELYAQHEKHKQDRDDP